MIGAPSIGRTSKRSRSVMNYDQSMLPKSLRPSKVDDSIVLEELINSYDDEIDKFGSSRSVHTPSSNHTQKRLEIVEKAEKRIEDWKNTEGYKQLGENVRNIVEKSMRKQRHSDFYYKLNALTERLYAFTDNFNPRVPKYA